MPPQRVTLPIGAIARASRDHRVIRAVADLFADVDLEMATYRKQCARCGQCCRFAIYDHRLFVTTMELAYLMAHARPDVSSPTSNSGDCIYQTRESCSIYPHRMLGCRIFLCKLPDTSSQGDLGARWHRAMIELHEEHCVPYCYAEWGDALRQMRTAKAR